MAGLQGVLFHWLGQTCHNLIRSVAVGAMGRIWQGGEVGHEKAALCGGGFQAAGA
jgi:hypothetical protein